MNGRIAKRIRRTVYTSDLSPRFRKYKNFLAKVINWILPSGEEADNPFTGKKEKTNCYQVLADGLRRRYQKRKRQYAENKSTLRSWERKLHDDRSGTDRDGMGSVQPLVEVPAEVRNLVEQVEKQLGIESQPDHPRTGENSDSGKD